MARRSSRIEYEKRMHRVLEHIDRHLDETLELDALAEVAYFSSFHFHRLFLACIYEMLCDYLQRRRLEVAALRLVVQPRVPVLSVALSVGFGSTEAFARAFKTRFGCTATAWREQEAQRRAQQRSNPDQSVSKRGQATRFENEDHGLSRHTSMENTMKVKVIERQPAKVAYMRHVGPYGKSISEFWMNVVAPWMEANDLLGRPRYGISHDDPSITAPEQCRYDACVEVQEDFVASGNAHTTTIPGGKYASTRFRGTGAEIGEAWTALMRDWLPESGMQLDARPFFEYYPVDANYDSKTGAFECDIVIPVIPL
ncbi:MAG: AraC family transcriptional regulator [Burkholderiaceae bacterium]